MTQSINVADELAILLIFVNARFVNAITMGKVSHMWMHFNIVSPTHCVLDFIVSLHV